MADGRAERQRVHVRGGPSFHVDGEQRHTGGLQDGRAGLGGRDVLSGRLYGERHRNQPGQIQPLSEHKGEFT